MKFWYMYTAQIQHSLQDIYLYVHVIYNMYMALLTEGSPKRAPPDVVLAQVFMRSRLKYKPLNLNLHG
jgi:hypothetical protein